MNVLAVTIEDVLSPGFFNPEERLYLTEESVVSEDPRGKNGKDWKKKYKDVVIVTTIGVDYARDRYYKQVMKTVRSCVNNFVGDYYWLKSENLSVTANTSLTTPDDKQKERAKLTQKKARMLYYDYAVPTNMIYNGTITSTRKTRGNGCKPLAPYVLQNSYKEFIEDWNGQYYGSTHTATTNFSGDTATIEGKIVERGYLGSCDGFRFDLSAENTINYAKEYKLKGNKLTVNQDITAKSKDVSTFTVNFIVNYSIKLDSDGYSISECEKFKRQSYEEYGQKYLDYYVW